MSLFRFIGWSVGRSIGQSLGRLVGRWIAYCGSYYLGKMLLQPLLDASFRGIFFYAQNEGFFIESIENYL